MDNCQRKSISIQLPRGFPFEDIPLAPSSLAPSCDKPLTKRIGFRGEAARICLDSNLLSADQRLSKFESVTVEVESIDQEPFWRLFGQGGIQGRSRVLVDI
eukprot:5268633-Pleurochrysis_carterae.AAC.1